ncbi:TadE family protein [Novosphingobium sp. 9]|uniref:TadE family protein n=1 Tax=Novosphingobium sp. 9 TaxID=2025349 RepID=UPI0021B6BEC2|nr:TadE/TadG family type IV pilus assembly protein [Novosphingobium sp. 9]
MLVEAALVMPVLIVLLLGIVTYGSWFMAAHSLQEVANDAARASMAGLTATERQTLVNTTVANSVLYQGTLNPSLVTIATAQDNAYYRVTLTYNAAKSSMYQNALIPLPSGNIVRNAVVQLAAP